MFAEVVYVNASEGHQYCSEIIECQGETTGEAFREFRKEYGRCISGVFIDRKDGSSVRVGWSFKKIANYENSKDKYLMETWITLLKDRPRLVTEYVEF